MDRTEYSQVSEQIGQLSLLDDCILCARRCGVDRLAGHKGPCQAGLLPRIAAWIQHRGEEPPLCGEKGSGTIFFSGCSLRCVYCQNYRISQFIAGEEVSLTRLARLMIELQERGSDNINLVSPTHYVPQIVCAIEKAKGMGLRLPVVYNSHGFDTPEALGLLEGLIDIYLPDLKYSDDANAMKLSGVKDYTSASHSAIGRMFGQVGHLEIDARTGIATRGLLVRILVLPGGLAGVRKSLVFLKEHLGTGLAISLMSQYHPMHRAGHYPPLDRTITAVEYEEATHCALELGFEEVWIQDMESTEIGIPDFSSDNPFIFETP